MGMTEAISKYNILGNDYVKLTELNDLIRDMKKKAMAGMEPGYIEPDEAKRTSAMLSLNHLLFVLNKEKCGEKLHMRIDREMTAKLEKTRAIREANRVIGNAKAALERAEKAVEAVQNEAEPDEKPGEYMVYKPGSNPREYWYFVEWRNGKPIIGQCDGMVFTYEGMAQQTAKKLGDGWAVVDVDQKAYDKTVRLLHAIFGDDEDGDEPEYHGDGTRAEDEDWDGE